ncbi:MAG: hypothetical protein H0W73_03835 [Bacteroidetes bacterium]|nr:hypothetical protein [Bacteroidota bacterium]
MKLHYILFFLVFSFKVFSQDIVSSGTSLESCQNSNNCYTVKGPSYLFYDESKNNFFLKIYFSDFKTEGDTTDTWINRTQDSLLYYRAELQKENIPQLSNQNTKTLKLNGQIYFGGKWKDQPIELTIYSSQNSIVNTANTNSNFKYDNYKVNFSLSFVPKDFKVYKKLYYLNQTISVNVTLGRINLLQPGMESILADIYYQPWR